MEQTAEGKAPQVSPGGSSSGSDKELEENASPKGGGGIFFRFLHGAGVSVLLACFAGLMVGSLRTTSVTVDEFGHLPAGYAYLVTGQSWGLSLNPPLQPVWAALPLLFDQRVKLDLEEEGPLDFWDLGRLFLIQNREHYHSLFFWPRMMTVLLAVMTGICGYAFARMLAGPTAGLFTLFLFCFSPDFLAHGGLVTTDLSAALSAVAFVTALLFYRRRPSFPRLLLAGVSTGLLCLSKFSVLIFLLLLPLFLFAPLPIPDTAEAAKLDKRKNRQVLLELAIIGLIAWLTTAAGYGFQGLFSPLAAFHFESDILIRLKKLAPGLPVPLPGAFLSAFDRQLAEHAQPWPVFLFGRFLEKRVPYYYVVCFLVKWPIAFLLLFLFSLLCLRRQTGVKAFWALGPAMWFLGWLSFSPARQIGVRLALPALIFFQVFAGVMAAQEWRRGFSSSRRLAKALLAAGFLWYALDTFLAYPHYLGYFNELAGGPRLPHRGEQWVADSNLDWGQDLIRLAEWQRRQGVQELWLATSGLVDPAVYGVHYWLSECQAFAGWHAVSVNLVLGMEEFQGQRRCYVVFRKLPVTERVGASIWIYHLSE